MQPAMPRWRLEAALDCIGLSILGATASSSCLKLEWHGLRAAYAAGGSPTGAPPCSPEQPGSGACRRRRSSSSEGGGLAGAAGQQAHELQLSWHQLALHVLEPRLSYQHPSFSPFAFAAAVVADAQRSRWAGFGGRESGCRALQLWASLANQGRRLTAWLHLCPTCPPRRDAHAGLPGGSPRGLSPRARAGPGSVGFGPLEGPGEVLYQRGRGGPLSASGAAGVRRNLSVGLGVAGAHGRHSLEGSRLCTLTSRLHVSATQCLHRLSLARPAACAAGMRKSACACCRAVSWLPHCPAPVTASLHRNCGQRGVARCGGHAAGPRLWLLRRRRLALLQPG